MRDQILNAAYNSFAIESDSITESAKVLDSEQLLKAVEALATAERIGAAGCGHSGIACQHFAHLMCCIERPARFISPAAAVHGAMGYIQTGDVLLWASRGGKTDELIPIVNICKQKGATIIGVTENLSSPLAEMSDIVLAMKVTRECDKYNCQGTTSFAVTCTIFDALQSALIERTNYQNEKFAVVHPGGAVGKRLNNK